MELRIFSKRMNVSSTLLGALFVVVMVAYSYHLDILQYLQTAIMSEEIAVRLADTEGQREPGLPLRLKIPKIGIDAEVEYVSLTSNGEMDVPKDIRNVAWYESGIRPGQIGSSVIAGHYGWSGGKTSAFDGLHRLHTGDKIYIEDDSGVVTSFIVRTSKTYEQQDDASKVFNTTDGRSYLNLITCEGEWDAVSQSYSKRLVVFAERE